MPPAAIGPNGFLLLRPDKPDDRTHLKAKVIAAQFGGIKPADLAIEIQRIRGFQPVAKQPREQVEIHRLIGNRKDRTVVIGTDANAVAALAAGAVRVEAGVEGAVDDQHRAGLGGIDGLEVAGEIGGAFGDPGLARFEPEDAVRFQVEIARAVIGIDAGAVAAAVTVEADGAAVFVLGRRQDDSSPPVVAS